MRFESLILLSSLTLLLPGIGGQASAPNTQMLRICSTREPARMIATKNHLSKLPIFNQAMSLGQLSAQVGSAQLGDITTFSQSVQEGILRPETWPQQTTLKVAFLSGDAAIQNRIEHSAIKWNGVANVRFVFIADPTQATIRIGVDGNGRSESLIGTDALGIVDKTKETMHFGWLTTFSSQAEYDSVVLHEFGHALGFVHEHQLPNTAISWNKAFVYKYCSSQWGWSQDDVDDNIFFQYTPQQLILTRMDPGSIMMYSFPAQWTLNNPPFYTPWNIQLSEGDKQLAAQVYPLTTSNSAPSK